jgi:hypothetical protein
VITPEPGQAPLGFVPTVRSTPCRRPPDVPPVHHCRTFGCPPTERAKYRPHIHSPTGVTTSIDPKAEKSLEAVAVMDPLGGIEKERNDEKLKPDAQ